MQIDPDRKRSTLKIATHDTDAMVLSPATIPVFSGFDSQDLLCGACAALISEGLTARSIRKLFSPQERLIVRCPACRAHNEIV